MDSSRVNGAADTAHQVRAVTVVFTQQPDGRLSVRASGAPGWAALVRTHEQLAHAVHRAFVECQVAAYSRWKGERYDQDPYPEEPAVKKRPRRPPPGERVRRDIYSPEQWSKTEDGRWLSPGGRFHKSGSRMANLIEAKRIKLGLPI